MGFKMKIHASQAAKKPFQAVILSAAKNLALSIFKAVAHARPLTGTRKP
jgi:hypothetical protein